MCTILYMYTVQVGHVICSVTRAWLQDVADALAQEVAGAPQHLVHYAPHSVNKIRAPGGIAASVCIMTPLCLYILIYIICEVT